MKKQYIAPASTSICYLESLQPLCGSITEKVHTIIRPTTYGLTVRLGTATHGRLRKKTNLTMRGACAYTHLACR